MSSPRDILAAARIRVATSWPYLSTVVFSLRPVEKEGLGTLAVDAGARLFYDPDKVTEWGNQKVAAVVYHEINHLLREHHERRHDRHPELWNIAGDAEINDDVPKTGMVLPDQPVTPKLLGMKDGLVAESYYAALLQNAKVVKVAAKGPGSGKCGGCAGNPGEGEGAEDGTIKTNAELPKATDGASGKDVAPLSEGELVIVRKQTAQEILNHQKSNGRGSVPAGLSLWAEKQLEPPKVPWQQILAKLVRRSLSEIAGMVDYNTRKISRRYWSQRSVFGKDSPLRPGWKQSSPKAMVVVDSSGSMSGKPFERALSEVTGVIKAMGLPVEGFAVDAAVYEKSRLSRAADVRKLCKGGGGTDMRLGIAEADKSKPDVIILLTDGETPWPDRSEMPRATLIVAIIGTKIVPPKHISNVVQVEVD